MKRRVAIAAGSLAVIAGASALGSGPHIGVGLSLIRGLALGVLLVTAIGYRLKR
ncbi:MAG: hypothetical protein P4L46_13770 [Fimbriimonas sp.]|nr:hypothetical protein [Fimbriimonas sp.]